MYLSQFNRRPPDVALISRSLTLSNKEKFAFRQTEEATSTPAGTKMLCVRVSFGARVGGGSGSDWKQQLRRLNATFLLQH